MVSVLQSVKVLIDPVDGMKEAVEARRWAWPLVALALCASFSAAAFASRLDASPMVLAQLESSGDLQKTTEQELAGKITTAHRLRLVTGIAKGLVVTPISVVVLAFVLELVGWLVGARGTFSKYLSAAALAVLPLALFHLIFGLSALRQPAVIDAQLFSLVPSSLAALAPAAPPALRRFLSSVDFFNFWSVGLLGVGLSVAAGIRRSRALLLGLALYAAYVGVFLIGFPGIRGEI